MSQQHAEKVRQACRLIETAEAEPKLDDLAAAVGLSPYHFHRVFKSVLGVTPKAYAAAHRSQRVREELGRSATVTAAIYGAGFNSNGRFYATSSETLGMTPNQFRAGAPDAEIKFADRRKLARPGADRRERQGRLRHSVRRRRLTVLRATSSGNSRGRGSSSDDPAFEQLTAKVIGFVEDPRRDLDLPLDIRGTAFQRRVWEALRRIPLGTTATYADIAKAIGAPKAVRAVGRACGSNPIALAIPCHRVVGSNGSLTGYRGGIERKRALLAKEAKS